MNGGDADDDGKVAVDVGNGGYNSVEEARLAFLAAVLSFLWAF